MKYFLVILVSFMFSSVIFSQEDTTDMAAQQKAWQEYMTPGWAHELLAKDEGAWDVSIKHWQAPDADPQVSNGEAVNEMLLDGRYLRGEVTSTMWGMPMKGYNLVAYDNTEEQFINVWYDNFGTGITVAKGKYDKNSKTIEMEGSMVDPVSKEEMTYWEKYKFVDDNNRVMEMYMEQDGQKFKTMEITYTRK